MMSAEHHFDPDHPVTRKLIEEHKADRLANPHVQMRMEYLKDFPHLAFKYWVEQIGDAFLYQDIYREAEASNG